MTDATRTAEVDRITTADLTELGTASGPAVSIFLPTARGGAEVRENPIRAKALIKEAEARLRANGAAQETADEILAPLVALLEDDMYWQQLADGLALYACQGLWRAYRVTTDFPEVVHVGERFAVRPIVPAALGDGGFLLLALSQNKVRLFEATSATIRERALGTIPASMDDADGESRPPAQHQQSFAAGGGGMVHSHGTGAEVGDVQLEKFLRQVADGLDRETGPTERRPLVLASVREYHSALRDHLSYGHLVDDVVAGNPDDSAPGALQETAWPVVEPVLRARAEDAAERFGDAIGAGRSIAGGGTDLLHAAREGRVDTLLLTRGRCAADRGPDDLDAAIGHALDTSASVVVVDALPQDVSEGAVLRF